MKRKDDNKIVIRVELGTVILMGIYSIFFIGALICSYFLKETEACIVSIIVLILTSSASIICFMKKEILYKYYLNEGILVIQNKYGDIHLFKLNESQCKIFKKEEKVLIQDSKDTVLLKKSKKLLRALEEVGLTKEL